MAAMGALRSTKLYGMKPRVLHEGTDGGDTSSLDIFYLVIALSTEYKKYISRPLIAM